MGGRRHKGMSIKVAMALYSAIVIIVLTILIVVAGYSLYENHVKENYKKYVTTVLEYAYSITEDYSFGDMIAAREMPDEYEEMRSALNHVKENSDIDRQVSASLDENISYDKLTNYDKVIYFLTVASLSVSDWN